MVKMLPICNLNTIKEQIYLIYRDSSIGDIVACEPIISKLRQKKNNFKIGWVVKIDYIDLLKFHPFLDYIIIVNNREEAWESLKSLQKNIIPILLYMYPRDKKTLEKYGKYLNVNKKITAATYYNYGSLLNAFSKAAGEYVGNVQPNFYIDNSLTLPIIIDKKGIEVKKYICVHCSSNKDDYGRDWDNKKWNEIIDFFGNNKIHTVEIGLSSVIKTKSRYYIDMTYENNLQNIAKIINNCEYFIGVDSGFIHIANALKKDGCCLIGKLRNNFCYHTPFTGMYRYKYLLRSKNKYAAFHITSKNVIDFYKKRNNKLFITKNFLINWFYVNVMQKLIRFKIYIRNFKNNYKFKI